MRLRSAIEDFEVTTLGRISGLLGRLSYVTRLQGGNETYAHWGLAKVYGNDAAQAAIRASYRTLLSEVLKKPLVVLLQDVPTSSSNEHLSEREFLARLAQSAPMPLSAAARAHLESVLSALSALVESRNAANLPGA